MKTNFIRGVLCSLCLSGLVLFSSCGAPQEAQSSASASAGGEAAGSASSSEEDSGIGGASSELSGDDAAKPFAPPQEPENGQAEALPDTASHGSSVSPDPAASSAADAAPGDGSPDGTASASSDTTAGASVSPAPSGDPSASSAAPDAAGAGAPSGSGDNTQAPISNGHIVAVDPGHQARGNSEQEPIGPGASETKAKVASGTSGAASGVPENELNLSVSLKLRDELERRGYQVVMIRETADVDISNAERAEIANQSGAEIFIRVHANGDDNSSVAGALTMAPSSSNPYVSQIASACQTLSQCVIDSYCSATGFRNRGVLTVDNMSGINWCTIPVTIVEMGFMTNPEEDMQMQDEAMQYTMASGIADGIDAYFGI